MFPFTLLHNLLCIRSAVLFSPPLIAAQCLLLCLALILPHATYAQYSAADCTQPLTLGSDPLPFIGCTNGILFQPGSLPAGTFHSILVESKPPTAPDDLLFFFGSAVDSPDVDLFGFLSTEGQLRNFNFPGEDFYVFGAIDSVDTVNDQCAGNNGGLPIRGCPTGYGQFFQVDGDNDGAFDDMEIAFIDGTSVPLNFRFLFVPLNWMGTQAQFDTAAQNQVNQFASSTGLGGCLNTVEVVTLDVVTQNFNGFTCATKNCQIPSIREFMRDNGLHATAYDVVIGLLPAGGSPCFPVEGCSNGMNTLWIEESLAANDTTLAHEIGHIYSLEDEYCSEESGGDARCAGPEDFNILGVDLNCDPNTGLGCCACQNALAPAGSDACSAICNPIAGGGNYFACCQGNEGALGGGSRCIMSASGAGVGGQNWCQRCLNRLNGREEFGCDALPTAPFQDLLSVDVSIADSDRVTLNETKFERGRPTRIDPPGTRYRITLDAQNGINILDEQFDIIHYDVPQQEVADVFYKASLPSGVPTDGSMPIVLTLKDSGEDIFRGTLFGTHPGLGLGVRSCNHASVVYASRYGQTTSH